MRTFALRVALWLAAASLAVTIPAAGQVTPALPGCPIGGYPTVSCPVMTDQVISEAVRTRLAGTASRPGTGVGVSVKNGVVTLTGIVDDQTRRELAGLLAASVPGVTRVDNQLVLLPAAERDAALAERVRDALSRAPIDLQQVNVDVSEGVVRLTGLVNSDYAREEAWMIAWGVPGVEAVQNNIITQGARSQF